MCHYCKKKGHLKKMCLQKKKQINQISDEKETLRQNTDCKVEDLFQISCLNNKAEPRRKILCSLDVEGELISFEIDTGSPVSIISLADAKKYFSKAKVKESDTSFYSYCNTRLECLGYIDVQAVEAELDKQVSEGLLEKTDKSEWASPIVVVQKVEGKVRICGDYKLTLNPALRIDEHPLPTIDELFRNTAGGTKFTKIDLSKAYLQLQIHPDDRHLLTLSTHRGLYQPTRMMFGIACAPAVWQRFMEKLVGDIPGVTVFLDDIKLTAPDDATHLERLEEILRRLDNHNMRVNLGKSQFLADRIEYCGYLIDKQGIHKMKQKVEAIQNMKTPTNKDEVRSCLGLLQNKVEFNWDAKCENALQSIKDVMQSDIVLTHYDPKLPITLAVDASPTGGAENTNADAMSRLPCPEKYYCIEEVDIIEYEAIQNRPVTVEELSTKTKADREVHKLVECLKYGRECDAKDRFGVEQVEFTLQKGCLLRGIRVYIPKPLRKRVLQELHTAHFGMSKMKSLGRAYCWWHNMDRDIENLVSNCNACQLVRAEPKKNTPVHCWATPTKVFERVHADYAGPIFGRYLFVLVDAFSKWPEVHIVPNMNTETTIQRCEDIFATFGLPNVFVSDHGTQFNSKALQSFLKNNGITHKQGAPYHPATNGQAERVVQTVKTKLRSANCTSNSMNRELANILMAYHRSIHPATGKSPAMNMNPK
ncbi:PREDICTED: uncharacterized protein K02A2.6-like [Rhagoletis zephyria]|uniref:uncharacterized protein K02A2.6-like n=1 Tax=Rhagoletis zephyria TaxID=28612 RepID=UPI0008118EFE|nr:PREDICTED: uncharacterized protein K02A2.6-like [Rhagoletis zephyria]